MIWVIKIKVCIYILSDGPFWAYKFEFQSILGSPALFNAFTRMGCRFQYPPCRYDFPFTYGAVSGWVPP